ncbi:hypothetical protein H6P81_003051 [Aristolochia fimbriata]|uniref:Uncharacterized protein n=1 Tax=Aristolochia fimbriata TaxID=158543 RepID=A0AAV7FBQ2_ARIFI|nr:hypothetical protein H6P81_003051 [Aristolochia fimbriata]
MVLIWTVNVGLYKIDSYNSETNGLRDQGAAEGHEEDDKSSTPGGGLAKSIDEDTDWVRAAGEPPDLATVRGGQREGMQNRRTWRSQQSRGRTGDRPATECAKRNGTRGSEIKREKQHFVLEAHVEQRRTRRGKPRGTSRGRAGRPATALKPQSAHDRWLQRESVSGVDDEYDPGLQFPQSISDRTLRLRALRSSPSPGSSPFPQSPEAGKTEQGTVPDSGPAHGQSGRLVRDENRTRRSSRPSPRLRLSIDQCPNLLRLPQLSSRFLQYLTIKDSNEGLLSRLDLSLFESLIYLSISGFPWMEQLPLGNHSTLMMLEIAKFPRLRNLPFDRLKRLVTLKISDCHEAASLLTGLESLTGLRTLTIKDCPGLTAVPVRCLSNVPSLDVINCGQLRFMEVGMQYLTGLKHLNIWDCKELRTLPHGLQNLPELTFLSIYDCESLESLPEWIGSLKTLGVLHMYNCPRVACLPAGLQRLTRLEILLVGRCPQLLNRCARGSGEDWYKIAHIPKIEQ